MKYLPEYYYPKVNRSKPDFSEIFMKPEPKIETQNIAIQKDLSEYEIAIQNLIAEVSQVEISYKDMDNIVISDGDPNSPIMFIGEAPGEQEVMHKKPFVGKSGKLLQEMLDCAGITRDKMYVTNAILWRPPNNRTPLPNEIEIMRSYLRKHIEIIKPKIIVLVGGIAYKCLMNESIAISKIRGIWQAREFCENIINIFHPSYLLRSLIHRRESWHDILSIRQKLIEMGYDVYTPITTKLN